MSRPAPGWYPDPLKQHELRWWDGKAWVGKVNDAGVVASTPLPQRKRRVPPRWRVVLGFVVSALALVVWLILSVIADRSIEEQCRDDSLSRSRDACVNDALEGFSFLSLPILGVAAVALLLAVAGARRRRRAAQCPGDGEAGSRPT